VRWRLPRESQIALRPNRIRSILCYAIVTWGGGSRVRFVGGAG
jgi:hypothetical protein